MRFSIVTPSFRQLGWLKRCARSIADQQGVEVEHIIQDAGTGPELEAWVAQNTRARLFVEKDQGMYDALNRGLARATGDILAHLNCDEQYLPDTLAAVAEEFDRHPEVDVIVGDFLIVGTKGELLSFRKVTKLRWHYLATDHLYAYTCATFYRRKVWDSGLRYRPELKGIADGQFIMSVVKQGFRSRNLHRYLATFTNTGDNLGHTGPAYDERANYLAALPRWMRVLTPVFRRARQVEKLFIGGYRSKPIDYAIYTEDDAAQRTGMRSEHPSAAFTYPTA